MISDSLTTPGGKTRHPVMISYFQSTDSAQRAVADIMGEGLSEQDFSLLLLGDDSAFNRNTWSSLFRRDKPRCRMIRKIRLTGNRTWGGGIATSTPDDDVFRAAGDGTIQRMLPTTCCIRRRGTPSAMSRSEIPRLAAITGFFETSLRRRPTKRSPRNPSRRSSFPGLGSLVGEGSFGSTILDKVFKEHDVNLGLARGSLQPASG